MIVLGQFFTDGKAPTCQAIHNYHTNHWVEGGALEFWDGLILDSAVLSCFWGGDVIQNPVAKSALSDSNAPI